MFFCPTHSTWHRISRSTCPPTDHPKDTAWTHERLKFEVLSVSLASHRQYCSSTCEVLTGIARGGRPNICHKMSQRNAWWSWAHYEDLWRSWIYAMISHQALSQVKNMTDIVCNVVNCRVATRRKSSMMLFGRPLPGVPSWVSSIWRWYA